MAWTVWTVTLVCEPGLWVPFGLANGEGWAPAAFTVVVTPVLPTVALVLATRRPANPVGWLLAGAGFWFGFGALLGQLATYGHRHDWPEATIGTLLAVDYLAFVGIALLPIAVVLFPDGRPPSPRWHKLVWANAIGVGLAAIGSPFGNEHLGDEFTVDNPFVPAVPRLPMVIAAAVGFALIVVSTVGAAVAVIVRWRRSHGDERAQMKWVALVGAVALVVMLVTQLTGVGTDAGTVVAVLLLFAGLPIAIAIAILKYRLYDIDLIVNRTIVYGLLTSVLACAYLAVVGISTAALGDVARTGSGLVAAALVALAFAPVRDRIQDTVTRRLFGDRHQPHVALERLGQRMGETVQSAQLLPAIVDAVATSLRLPFVAVEPISSGPASSTSVGIPRGPLVEVPLRCEANVVGTLIVSGRSPNEPLSRADREVLDQLAVHLGVAVHAATLTTQLQQSRARLVAAQEDERRRLRRDLHDELGPALTAIGFGLDTVDNLVAVGSPQDDLHTLITRLRDQTDQALAQIRRVAYALRPPALDELGLVGALIAQAESLGRSGLLVDVRVDGAIDDLPAGVEAAAYRIGVEAMTNAARHAHAHQCHVRLQTNGMLTLEIADDGVGIAAADHPGVGLASMRERAAELGGGVDVGAAVPTGCVIRAWLPLDTP